LTVFRVHDCVAGIKELHGSVDIFAKQRTYSTVGPTSPDLPFSKLFLQDHTVAGISKGDCKVIVKHRIDRCVLLYFLKGLFVIGHHC